MERDNALQKELDQEKQQKAKKAKPRFKLKHSLSKESRDAQKRLEKAHKLKSKELKKLSNHDKKVYLELSGPNNPVMQVLKYGSDE